MASLININKQIKLYKYEIWGTLLEIFELKWLKTGVILLCDNIDIAGSIH